MEETQQKQDDLTSKFITDFENGIIGNSFQEEYRKRILVLLRENHTTRSYLRLAREFKKKREAETSSWDFYGSKPTTPDYWALAGFFHYKEGQLYASQGAFARAIYTSTNKKREAFEELLELNYKEALRQNKGFVSRASSVHEHTCDSAGIKL